MTERPIPIGKEILNLAGSIIEVWPETRHVTIFYEINPAKGPVPNCTACKKPDPITIRFEKDHLAQEFYDLLCENCTPKRVNEMRSKG